MEKRLEFCHSVFIFTQGERGAGGWLKKYRWEKRSLSCKTITQQKAEKICLSTFQWTLDRKNRRKAWTWKGIHKTSAKKGPRWNSDLRELTAKNWWNYYVQERNELHNVIIKESPYCWFFEYSIIQVNSRVLDRWTNNPLNFENLNLDSG